MLPDGNVDQRLAVIYGYPDKMIGERVWISSGQTDGKGSLVIAVTNKVFTDPPSWNIDVYQMLASEPWIALSRKGIISGLTEAEMKSMSFKAGSFEWITGGMAKEFRFCSYTEKYDIDSGKCLPCTKVGDLNNGVFGTFMIQQSTCISCNTMATVYSSDLIAMQDAYLICKDPLAEKTTAEWLSILNPKPIDETVPRPNWFIRAIWQPYLDKTNALSTRGLTIFVHALVVLGFCLITLSIILTIYFCKRKHKDQVKKGVATGPNLSIRSVSPEDQFSKKDEEKMSIQSPNHQDMPTPIDEMQSAPPLLDP